MDNTFYGDEILYRAVLPPERRDMFWKKNGQVSSAAFYDPCGLSVERGYYRETKDIIEGMRRNFIGPIVSVSVQDCRNADIVVKYLPSERSEYHSEVHGSESEKLLNRKQRIYLAAHVKIEKEE